MTIAEPNFQLRTQPLTAGEQYREDHRVPLCPRGHPRDTRNLWPQPYKATYSDNDKTQ